MITDSLPENNTSKGEKNILYNSHGKEYQQQRNTGISNIF